MIRVLFVFLIVFAIFFFGIQLVSKLSGKEKWQLTKIVAYSTMCALLATVSLIAIVVIF